MTTDKKVLQGIIDRVDPHDNLREDELTIKIAELYAQHQCQKLHELVKAQDELIEHLKRADYSEMYFNSMSITNKIKQLKSKIT